jgi:hypothetical protein
MLTILTDALPSTVPEKRRAECSAEQRSRGPKVANPPWQTTALAPVPTPIPQSPSIIVPPLQLRSAEAFRSSSPTPPAREPQCASGADPIITGESADQTNSGWPVTLEWYSTGRPSHTKVLATDQIGDL